MVRSVKVSALILRAQDACYSLRIFLVCLRKRMFKTGGKHKLFLDHLLFYNFCVDNSSGVWRHGPCHSVGI